VIIVNGGDMNIDLYELNYRNCKKFENGIPDTNINISARTTKSVRNILNDIFSGFQHIVPSIRDDIKFSDVICNVLPVFDEETYSLSYRYEYIFINENKDSNPNEYVRRYKNFDVNTLPLIEVANYLNIKVEKSNMLKPYGTFMPTENKIILGSDYAPVFIHELAHAIDHILGNSFEEYFLEYVRCFDEVVAELSTVVLCRTYNISIDISRSMFYLIEYVDFKKNINDVIKKVSLICEYVKKCIEKIKKITAHNRIVTVRR
jgi:L-rhamnose mutarotase